MQRGLSEPSDLLRAGAGIPGRDIGEAARLTSSNPRAYDCGVLDPATEGLVLLPSYNGELNFVSPDRFVGPARGSVGSGSGRAGSS
jgi:hypothetical protein